jgi:hypothetical protein
MEVSRWSRCGAARIQAARATAPFAARVDRAAHGDGIAGDQEHGAAAVAMSAFAAAGTVLTWAAAADDSVDAGRGAM